MYELWRTALQLPENEVGKLRIQTGGWERVTSLQTRHHPQQSVCLILRESVPNKPCVQRQRQRRMVSINYYCQAVTDITAQSPQKLVEHRSQIPQFYRVHMKQCWFRRKKARSCTSNRTTRNENSSMKRTLHPRNKRSRVGRCALVPAT